VPSPDALLIYKRKRVATTKRARRRLGRELGIGTCAPVSGTCGTRLLGNSAPLVECDQRALLFMRAFEPKAEISVDVTSSALWSMDAATGQ
jgi:hypothetical protein